MKNEEGKKMNGPNATAGGADAGQYEDYEDYQVPYDENEIPPFLPFEMGEDERKAFGWLFDGRMKDDAPLALQLRREEPCGMVYNPQKFKGLYTRNEIPKKELSAFVEMLQYHVVEECFELEKLENKLFDFCETPPSLYDRGWWLSTDIEGFFGIIREMPKAECEGGVYFLDLNDFATRYDKCPACILCNGCSMPNDGRFMIDGGQSGGILNLINRVLENFGELLGEYRRNTNPYWKDIISTIEDLRIDIEEDLHGELITSNTLDWDRIKEIHDTIIKHVREFRKACAVEQAEEERCEKGGVVLEPPEEPPHAQAVEAPANDDATKAKEPRGKGWYPKTNEAKELFIEFERRRKAPKYKNYSNGNLLRMMVGWYDDKKKTMRTKHFEGTILLREAYPYDKDRIIKKWTKYAMNFVNRKKNEGTNAKK